MLGSFSPIKFSENEPPKLMVVIDTEEEFDWDAPVNRSRTSVFHMNFIERVQEILDSYGIVPCYVMDYPILSRSEGYQNILRFYKEGRCEIGAHLHPWVNPPFSEKINEANTFPGNLPKHLEEEKLSVLKSKINEVFGVDPIIYKAGRYGVGPNTSDILTNLGFCIDVSVFPPVDFSYLQGPDFSDASSEPYWFGHKDQLLEIPSTGAFVGWVPNKSLYNFGLNFKRLLLPGVFSRLSMVDRLVLSPEGYTTQDHIKLTDFLYQKGVRLFTWSFHSSSVFPGNNPYVRNEQELKDFLNKFRLYFDYFFKEMGGGATTPTQIYNTLAKSKKC